MKLGLESLSTGVAQQLMKVHDANDIGFSDSVIWHDTIHVQIFEVCGWHEFSIFTILFSRITSIEEFHGFRERFYPK